MNSRARFTKAKLIEENEYLTNAVIEAGKLMIRQQEHIDTLTSEIKNYEGEDGTVIPISQQLAELFMDKITTGSDNS